MKVPGTDSGAPGGKRLAVTQPSPSNQSDGLRHVPLKSIVTSAWPVAEHRLGRPGARFRAGRTSGATTQSHDEQTPDRLTEVSRCSLSSVEAYDPTATFAKGVRPLAPAYDRLGDDAELGGVRGEVGSGQVSEAITDREVASLEFLCH